MNTPLQEMLSICIVGNACSPDMAACVAGAQALTDRVFRLDPDGNDGKESAGSGGEPIAIGRESLLSATGTAWVLFLRDDDRLRVSSPEELRRSLSDTVPEGYLVCVKDGTVAGSLPQYQFIGNLGQFETMGKHAFVARLEYRLARKDRAVECLDTLLGDAGEDPSHITRIAGGFHLFRGMRQAPEVREDSDDHDMRHLKGEIYYGPVPGEGLDELSSAYMGFRVLHERYLESFLESADHGFGIDGMYLPMIDHLCKKGNFEGARSLFEKWTANRTGDETVALCRVGGFVYGHLLMLDEAIAWYGKSNDLSADPSITALLGELYLIKGDRKQSKRLLGESIAAKPSEFHERLLAAIVSEQWRPPILTLCMIARDEEQTIGRSLDSVTGVVDEIVVLDTGSSDRTGEIAGACGARVIKTRWQDDFSTARNEALREATGDYVLFLDADEYIDPGDRLGLALLKMLLPQDRDAAYRVKILEDEKLQELSVSVLNTLMKEHYVSHQVRVIPRVDGLFFSGPAFESLDTSLGNTGIKVGDASLFQIIHGRENGAFRDERMVPAVRKSLGSTAGSPAFFKGGLFFLKRGDLDQAYPWFQKVEKAEPHFVVKIAKLYTSQRRYEYAESIIQKALNHFPDSLALVMALAEVYFKDERYADVTALLRGRNDSDDTNAVNLEALADAFFYYGISLLETGEIAEAIPSVAAALEKEPLDTRYRLGGLYALARSEQWNQFLEAAERIVRQEGIEIDFEIGDFADIGRLIFTVLRHLAGENRGDEIWICKKMLAYLIRTKIAKKGEVDRMQRIMEETDRMISGMGM